ncbi:hypothetical protein AAC387_Pa02g3645 [Persea americana]
MRLEFSQEGGPELPPTGDGVFRKRAKPPQGEIRQTGGEDSTVQGVVIPPDRHLLDVMSEMSRRVRGSVIQGKPQDAELLGECVFSSLPIERRRASVLGFEGTKLVSDDTSSLHILADRLLHPLVDPLL